MARFGTFHYGEQPYGVSQGAVTRSTLLAQVLSYATIHVTISVPARSGYDYVLVRTHNGPAEHPAAGVAVARGTANSTYFSITDGIDNFLDDDEANDVDLTSGWVYYTLFVFDASSAWLREAATSVVLPADRGTLDYLINALPSVYTAADANPLTPPDLDSDLYRFLGAITLTYDELAVAIDHVLPDVRARAAIRRLHDSYARGVGMPSEYTIGTAATARLCREAGYIYRNKGTVAGVRAYVEALTGWQATVIESTNLFLSLDDASFEETTGNWHITGGSLDLTPSGLSGATPPVAALFDYQSPLSAWGVKSVGRVTLAGSTATLQLPSAVDRSLCIPVTAGSDYRFAVPAVVKSSADDVTLVSTVRWYAADGTNISDSSGSSHTLSTSWSLCEDDVTAPTGAAFAVLKIVISGATGDIVDLDMLSFVAESGLVGGELAYRDPRSVTIICDPARVNLAVDPSFDGAGDAWTAVDGTFEADDTASYIGTSSGKLTGDPFEVSGAQPFAAVPGERYSLSTAAMGEGTLIASIDFLDEDLALLDSVEVDFGTLASTSWVVMEASGTAPEDAVWATISFRGASDAGVNVDGLVAEMAPTASVYFDGATSNGAGDDASWSGSPAGSFSVLYPQRVVKVARLLDTIGHYLPNGLSAYVALWDSADQVAQAALPALYVEP